jgi:hydrogenase nickel incorporation protein HypA/HybF
MGADNTTMHELSIAISMIEQISEESTVHGGTAIVAVHLLLGRLSGVDKAALMFCYEAACEGTLLEGSHLVIEEVPVVVYCAACCAESEPQSIQQLACPRCNFAAKVVRGYELEIEALEVLA